MNRAIVDALASAVVVLVSIFLLGQRLDARWAGGLGRIEPCPAMLLDTSRPKLARGELMSSPADSYVKYQLCDGTLLFLDSNTQIRLSNYRNPLTSQNTELDLIQGRVIVDGLADVRARNTVVSIAGAGCELVHYSWLDELDVTPLSVESCKINNPPTTPEALRTSRFNTFDSSLISTNDFKPHESSAKSFYEWTELSF